jgi:hypothetical protein
MKLRCLGKAAGVTLACALFVGAAFAPAQEAGASSPLTGSIFHVVPTPNNNFNNDLLAVSASSSSDIWAVGQTTMHYDGTNWTAFEAPMIHGDNTSFLGGVADVSPTLAWAVGTVGIDEGNPGQVIEQWNGTEWSVAAGPHFTSGEQPSLYGMTMISPDDIWAVGNLLVDNAENDVLFEQYNGQSWTATAPFANLGFLLAISADASNDIWAVGFSGAENDNSQTLVVHYDGKSWSIVESPSVGNGANQLNGVLALAPDNVWAVGFSTPEAPPQEAAALTLIEHWDGTSWTVVSSPNQGPTSIYESNKLHGVTAVSSTDLYAFGEYFAASGSGNQMTLLLHYNGTAWSIIPSPNPTKSNFLSDFLGAGVVPSPGIVWIVGGEDDAPHDNTLAIETTSG